MSTPSGKITNGIIEEAVVRLDRGFALCVWLFIKHEDGGTQGFGGYVLGATPDAAAGNHANQPNLAAEFIVSCLRVGGVESFDQLKGKAIRVVRENDSWNAPIKGIGHIIKGDCWFIAEERMNALNQTHKAMTTNA